MITKILKFPGVLLDAIFRAGQRTAVMLGDRYPDKSENIMIASALITAVLIAAIFVPAAFIAIIAIAHTFFFIKDLMSNAAIASTLIGGFIGVTLSIPVVREFIGLYWANLWKGPQRDEDDRSDQS